MEKIVIHLFCYIRGFKLVFPSTLSSSLESIGRTNNYNSCTVDTTQINRSLVWICMLALSSNTQISNAKMYISATLVNL